MGAWLCLPSLSFPTCQTELKSLPLMHAGPAGPTACQALKLPTPYDHFPAASQPRVGNRTGGPERGTNLPKVTQPVGPERPPGPGIFPLPLCWGREPAGSLGLGDTQGWGRSALSPERAASSTLERSCEADSEFPPHVVEGREGTAAGLFPFTECLLCPGPHATAFPHVASLNAHRNPTWRVRFSPPFA